MNRVKAVLLGAAVALTVAASSTPVHEVTHMGTVTAIRDGSIEVMVHDERSGAEASMTFLVTAETKIYRGDDIVLIAAAGIEVGERIAVTVNTEASGNRALVVRLAEHEHH
ncbi:MAG: hypothetical protein ABL963_00450 [Longimicrobiales bacterium]